MTRTIFKTKPATDPPPELSRLPLWGRAWLKFDRYGVPGLLVYYAAMTGAAIFHCTGVGMALVGFFAVGLPTSLVVATVMAYHE